MGAWQNCPHFSECRKVAAIVDAQSKQARAITPRPRGKKMIYDALAHLHNYLSCHHLFPKVLDFINSHDLSNIETGKVDIGEGVYAVISEYTTDDIKNKFIECHKKYIDLQIVVDGVEQIGICDKNECKIIEAYNKDKDLEKIEGKMDFITLKNGRFVIFFPQDGHAPGIKADNREGRVKKAVFKVPL